MVLSALYPTDVDARDGYLSGLNGMRLAGRGDHRPFASPLTIAVARQDAPTLLLLTTKLGLTTVDSLLSASAPVNHPNSVAGYQLYPGGKIYYPPILQDIYGGSLQDLTLEPDAINNPLGLFRSRGSLAVNSNVHLRGTLVGETNTSDVQVHGTNVSFEAVNLAPIEGSSNTYQLPVNLLRDDLRIHGTSNATIRGLTMVYDEFELRQGPANAQFAMHGKLVTNGLRLRGRDEWTLPNWGNDYDDFSGTGGLLAILLNTLLNTIRNALGLNPGDTVYFPEYMQHVRGLTVQPQMTFQTETTGVKYHWHNWSQPIYQKDPSDPGLRWNLIRWVEGS
jgi:hypothetical protein